MTLNNDALVKKDRLRFTKDKLSANLTLLAIIADALYFVSIYKSDVGTYYYNYMIGISVLYNLIFMLAAFLSSEGVKGYKVGYSIVLIVLGIIQIGRIFIIPVKAWKEPNPVLDAETPTVMADGQFWYVTICLCVSAGLLILAGVISFAKTAVLKSYQAELEKRTRGSKS